MDFGKITFVSIGEFNSGCAVGFIAHYKVESTIRAAGFLEGFILGGFDGLDGLISGEYYSQTVMRAVLLKLTGYVVGVGSCRNREVEGTILCIVEVPFDFAGCLCIGANADTLDGLGSVRLWW